MTESHGLERSSANPAVSAIAALRRLTIAQEARSCEAQAKEQKAFKETLISVQDEIVSEILISAIAGEWEYVLWRMYPQAYKNPSENQCRIQAALHPHFRDNSLWRAAKFSEVLSAFLCETFDGEVQMRGNPALGTAVVTWQKDV